MTDGETPAGRTKALIARQLLGRAYPLATNAVLGDGPAGRLGVAAGQPRQLACPRKELTSVAAGAATIAHPARRGARMAFVHPKANELDSCAANPSLEMLAAES